MQAIFIKAFFLHFMSSKLALEMNACMFDIQIDITIFILLSNDNKVGPSQS